MTHDERLLEKSIQKNVTFVFMELQKKLFQGDISYSEYNKEQNKIYNEMFTIGKDDKMHLSKLSPKTVQEMRKRLGACETEIRKRRRCSHALRMPGWRNEEDTDAALEEDENEDKNNIESYYDDFDSTNESDVEGITTIKLDIEDDETLRLNMPAKKRAKLNGKRNNLNNNPPSTEKTLKPNTGFILRMEEQKEKFTEICRKMTGEPTEKERRQKQRNIEYREMLMRKLDQRAPPEERMFPQITFGLSDGPPTEEQIESWRLWRMPYSYRPKWMQDNYRKSITFPCDKKKIGS